MGTVNFANAVKQVGTGEPLPDGAYDIEVTRTESKVTRTGKPMFDIRAVVLTGEHANRSLRFNIVYTPPEEHEGAAFYFFKKMEGLGVGNDVFESNPEPSQVAQLLVGKRANVTIERQEDARFINVNYIKPLDAVGGQAPTTAAPAQPQPQPQQPAAPAPAPQPQPPVAAPTPQPPAEEPF